MAARSEDFARAFGDALQAFLIEKNLTAREVAPKLGVTNAALSTYWTNDFKGKRRKARAELLFKACMLGFEFEYKGYRVTAASLGASKGSPAPVAEQLHFEFARQFNLTEDNGQVSIRLKRHPGRVEFSVTLKAAS